MTAALVPDGLWDMIEPLLPLPKPKPQGGRPRLSDRACLRGILFVLRSGIPWEMLPKGLGCGSGMTCWRRLRDWQQSGIWQLIHFALLDWLSRQGSVMAYCGKEEAAFRMLKIGIDENYCAVSALEKDPLLDKLRRTPGFSQ